MIIVKIKEDDVFNLLMDRIEVWTKKDSKAYKLFESMYSNYINSGLFEDMELDVMKIVDNDYVNYCQIIEKDDEGFNEILKLHKEGNYDISCQTCYSNIEAVSEDETMILVRH